MQEKDHYFEESGTLRVTPIEPVVNYKKSSKRGKRFIEPGKVSTSTNFTPPKRKRK